MRLLALDTSGPAVSAAVLEENKVLSFAFQNTGLTHSDVMMPLVAQVLQSAGIEKEELTLLACAIGPGSFTGVRIGVSTMQGLGMALDLPIVPVGSLDALSFASGFGGNCVCPILDARAGQVYTALYQKGETILPPQAIKRDEWVKILLEQDKPILFCGDGVKAHFPFFQKEMGERAQAAPFSVRELSAAAIGEWALAHRDTALPHTQLRPFYLRLAQAERERNARLSKA